MVVIVARRDGVLEDIMDMSLAFKILEDTLTVFGIGS